VPRARSDGETAAAPPEKGSTGSDSTATRATAPRDGETAAAGSAAVRTGGRSRRSAPPLPDTGRTRGDRPVTGAAIARKHPPPPDDPIGVLVPGGYYGGFYPWGYGGVGFGGYYGGFYDPWYWGGYPGYPGGSYGGFDGQLRLKMKPRHASVHVDGYYAGVVDEFDGVFQRLHIEPGPHRIEVQADGYEPLVFEIRIQPDRTITYTGELKRIQ
jgi:hypothetical protein